MSIVSKVSAQMNYKLGGEPWHGLSSFSILIPRSLGTTHHRRAGLYVLWLPAQVAPSLKYLNVTNSHANPAQELCPVPCHHQGSEEIQRDKWSPARIIMYRDEVGEGDGQINYVIDHKLAFLVGKRLHRQLSEQLEEILCFPLVIPQPCLSTCFCTTVFIFRGKNAQALSLLHTVPKQYLLYTRCCYFQHQHLPGAL